MQGLLQALQKGFLKGPEKGARKMGEPAASSAEPATEGSRRNRGKPAWVDVALAAEQKALAKSSQSPEKQKAKEENLETEQEEWWEKDWKKGGKDWDSWWKEKQREWEEWKEEERAQEKDKERHWWTKEGKEEEDSEKKEEEERALTKKLAQEKDLAEHIQQNVLRGPKAEWHNRNGSAKEAAKKRWATRAAESTGQDADMARLGAIGQSRLRRLINRQEDRLTQKEVVASAERAAAQAAQAAYAAQSATWTMWQGSYMWPAGLG